MVSFTFGKRQIFMSRLVSLSHWSFLASVKLCFLSLNERVFSVYKVCTQWVTPACSREERNSEAVVKLIAMLSGWKSKGNRDHLAFALKNNVASRHLRIHLKDGLKMGN